MITAIPHFRYYCAGTLLLLLALAMQPQTPTTAAYAEADAPAPATPSFLRLAAANQPVAVAAAPSVRAPTGAASRARWRPGTGALRASRLLPQLPR